LRLPLLLICLVGQLAVKLLQVLDQALVLPLLLPRVGAALAPLVVVELLALVVLVLAL
jgi:hypothetical protein